MSAGDGSMFGYRICPTEAGWSWKVFDTSGVLRAKGSAATKAMAAAFVIRAHARIAVEPEARAA